MGEVYRTISFCDMETGGLYSDLMEIKILELKKLRKDVPEHGSVYGWMKFFSGKNRKEFDDMAQTDEYIGEACEELKKLSADERKRLEYEAREKALRDYNSQVKSYYDRGHAAGQELGRAEGRAVGHAEGVQETILDNIRNLMHSLHLTPEQAMAALKIPAAEQKKYRSLL